MKTTILCVLALLCLNFRISAQVPKSLTIGDKLPESFWLQEHFIYKDGKEQKQNLMPYKGKFILIDFWATWCSGCLKKFAFLDSLQQRESTKMNVLLVNSIKTKDNLAKIKVSFQRARTTHNAFNLSTVYNDNYLVQLFPHYLLSHYVWINETGVVVGLTGSAFLNTTSIQSLLSRE